jgi:hypothetical protein
MATVLANAAPAAPKIGMFMPVQLSLFASEKVAAVFIKPFHYVSKNCTFFWSIILGFLPIRSL